MEKETRIPDHFNWPVVLTADGHPIGIFRYFQEAFDHAERIDPLVKRDLWLSRNLEAAENNPPVERSQIVTIHSPAGSKLLVYRVSPCPDFREIPN